MKVFRYLTAALPLACVMALAMINSGCEYAKKVIAKDKINQGAILYNQGRTKQAQVFFEEATKTDPNMAVAWLYLGATLYKEYKEGEQGASFKVTEQALAGLKTDGLPGDVLDKLRGIKDRDVTDKRQFLDLLKTTIGNEQAAKFESQILKRSDKLNEKAYEALDVYQKALELSGKNCALIDNAVTYVATIYNDLNDKAEWRKWMQQRADSECATKEVKAQSYHSIAVNYWQCSYDETKRYQDATAKDPFHYRNMDYAAALPDKQKAENCVAKGMEFVEKALELDPNYVDAMYYRGLLYRERQKLTKDESKRKELDQMAVKIAKEADAVRQQQQGAPRS
jgi:Tfp pilus assembly protein PilF